MSTDTLSPSARKVLARLLLNEQRGRLTHRSAMHQSTREALMRRGLVKWKRRMLADGTPVDTDYVMLTDEGIATAHQVGVL